MPNFKDFSKPQLFDMSKTEVEMDIKDPKITKRLSKQFLISIRRRPKQLVRRFWIRILSYILLFWRQNLTKIRLKSLKLVVFWPKFRKKYNASYREGSSLQLL